MKRNAFFFLLSLLFVLPMAAKDKEEGVYIFGYAFNFSDSTLYATPIQRLDNSVLDKKTGFLIGRSTYAEQLKSYIAETLGKQHETCVIFFDKKRAAVEKQLVKLRRLARKNGYAEILEFDSEYFRFDPVKVSSETLSQPIEPPAAEKAPKNNRKERPEGGRPGTNFPPNGAPVGGGM